MNPKIVSYLHLFFNFKVNLKVFFLISKMSKNKVDNIYFKVLRLQYKKYIATYIKGVF